MNAARLLRCTLVWLAATALAAAVVAAVRKDVAALAHGVGPDLEQALLRVGSAVLVGCAVWAWLATTAVVLHALRGAAGRPLHGVPQAWRRLVLLACGTALAAGLAAPATASADRGLAGLPLPDRATGGPAEPAASAETPDAVLVRPGDSLWALAAARLGPHASAAEVDRAWRVLYRLNRPVVGPDPDLIRPGQQLQLPTTPEETP